jgi:hypothetical protein
MRIGILRAERRLEDRLGDTYGGIRELDIHRDHHLPEDGAARVALLLAGCSHHERTADCSWHKHPSL